VSIRACVLSAMSGMCAQVLYFVLRIGTYTVSSRGRALAGVVAEAYPNGGWLGR